MPSTGQVLTKAALLTGKSSADFKEVVHESKKFKKPLAHSLNSTLENAEPQDKSKQKKSETSSFDLYSAKKEVINLGISGFSNKQKKEEAEIALAIKLGAKPPKRKYKNYKEILEEKKQKYENQETTTEKISKKFQFGATQSFQKYVAATKFKSKKNPKNVLQDYGKVKKKDARRKR